MALANENLGKRFGKLIVVELLPPEKHKAMCRCLCECGNEIVARLNNLRTGGSQSCGCGRKPKALRMKDSPAYGIWRNMIKRCRPNGCEYYALRGIRVCERWVGSFEAFCEDMGPRPEGYTIERIDNNGNYEPQNCRWATLAEQARNTRKNRWLTFHGKTQLMADWARQFRVRPSLLHKWMAKYGEAGGLQRAESRVAS